MIRGAQLFVKFIVKHPYSINVKLVVSSLKATMSIFNMTESPLQDPLRGGKDKLFEHMVSVIHADDHEALAKDAMAPPMRRFVPEILLKLAGHISPF